MDHITEWPEGLERKFCTHKRTKHAYGVLKHSTNVETTSGTVPARRGDVLVESSDGQKIWPLRAEEFEEGYDL